jgi:phosphopentomutase
MRRAFLIILDGVGYGSAPDSSLYGDDGANTLAHVASAAGPLHIPVLQSLGLANISHLDSVDPIDRPRAVHGLLREHAAGKDSVAGHWELTGVITEVPFPTYPDGFPEDVVDLVKRISGREIIGNVAASGTEIMERLGGEHIRTGDLILYTSADSVLQILAHEEVVPLEELYRICEQIHLQLENPHRVGRVIARPFIGREGAFERTTNRKDIAQEPIADTILDKLVKQQIPVYGIGKVGTLFANRGFSTQEKTGNNELGMAATVRRIRGAEGGLTFTNLLDFDTHWGHRNNPEGFARGLEAFDNELGGWLNELKSDDLMIITADHGNDPTYPGTDHTREQVPLLAFFGGGSSGQQREIGNFSDVAATLAEFFNLDWDGPGTSFLTTL